jgi:hypothetical protein
MSMEIKLNLSDNLVESAKHLGEATQEDVSTVLREQRDFVRSDQK